MKLLLIGCDVILRELCEALLHSPHTVHTLFLPAGLHDRGTIAMRSEVQKAIDDAEGTGYDAIVLGYGLCGNGLAGLRARGVRLVIPRAHDCITLLLGSRKRYADFFLANSGTYYRSIGWVERREELPMQVFGMDFDATRLDKLIEQYGESNGRYLYDEMTRYVRNYDKLVFIQTGIEPDGSAAEAARAEAAEKSWSFELIEGELGLFRRLLAGDWSDDFLIVPVGFESAASHDDGVLKSVPISQTE
jgi:hypothetical protein